VPAQVISGGHVGGGLVPGVAAGLRPALHLGDLAGERAELDVAGAGQVPAGVLAGLPDVDDGGRVYLAGGEQRGGRDRLPGGLPGGQAAV